MNDIQIEFDILILKLFYKIVYLKSVCTCTIKVITIGKTSYI